MVYVDSDDLGLSSETYEKHKDYIQLKKKKLNKKDRDENQAHLVVEVRYNTYVIYKTFDIKNKMLFETGTYELSEIVGQHKTFQEPFLIYHK